MFLGARVGDQLLHVGQLHGERLDRFVCIVDLILQQSIVLILLVLLFAHVQAARAHARKPIEISLLGRKKRGQVTAMLVPTNDVLQSSRERNSPDPCTPWDPSRRSEP